MPIDDILKNLIESSEQEEQIQDSLFDGMFEESKGFSEDVEYGMDYNTIFDNNDDSNNTETLESDEISFLDDSNPFVQEDKEYSPQLEKVEPDPYISSVIEKIKPYFQDEKFSGIIQTLDVGSDYYFKLKEKLKKAHEAGDKEELIKLSKEYREYIDDTNKLINSFKEIVKQERTTNKASKEKDKALDNYLYSMMGKGDKLNGNLPEFEELGNKIDEFHEKKNEFRISLKNAEAMKFYDNYTKKYVVPFYQEKVNEVKVKLEQIKESGVYDGDVATAERIINRIQNRLDEFKEGKSSFWNAFGEEINLNIISWIGLQGAIDSWNVYSVGKKLKERTDINLDARPIEEITHDLKAVFPQDWNKTGSHIKIKKEKKTKSELQGTRVHKFAEAYAKNRNIQPSTPKELAVKQFIDKLPKHVRIVATEMKVDGEDIDGNKKKGIIDLLLYNEATGKLIVVDWKTAQDPSSLFRDTEKKMNIPNSFTDIPDNKFNHYRKQLSNYKKILKDKGFDVEDNVIALALDSGKTDIFNADLEQGGFGIDKEDYQYKDYNSELEKRKQIVQDMLFEKVFKGFDNLSEDDKILLETWRLQQEVQSRVNLRRWNNFNRDLGSGIAVSIQFFASMPIGSFGGKIAQAAAIKTLQGAGKLALKATPKFVVKAATTIGSGSTKLFTATKNSSALNLMKNKLLYTAAENGGVKLSKFGSVMKNAMRASKFAGKQYYWSVKAAAFMPQTYKGSFDKYVQKNKDMWRGTVKVAIEEQFKEIDHNIQYLEKNLKNLKGEDLRKAQLYLEDLKDYREGLVDLYRKEMKTIVPEINVYGKKFGNMTYGEALVTSMSDMSLENFTEKAIGPAYEYFVKNWKFLNKLNKVLRVPGTSKFNRLYNKVLVGTPEIEAPVLSSWTGEYVEELASNILPTYGKVKNPEEYKESLMELTDWYWHALTAANVILFSSVLGGGAHALGYTPKLVKGTYDLYGKFHNAINSGTLNKETISYLNKMYDHIADNSDLNVLDNFIGQFLPDHYGIKGYKISKAVNKLIGTANPTIDNVKKAVTLLADNYLKTAFYAAKTGSLDNLIESFEKAVNNPKKGTNEVLDAVMFRAKSEVLPYLKNLRDSLQTESGNKFSSQLRNLAGKSIMLSRMKNILSGIEQSLFENKEKLLDEFNDFISQHNYEKTRIEDLIADFLTGKFKLEDFDNYGHLQQMMIKSSMKVMLLNQIQDLAKSLNKESKKKEDSKKQEKKKTKSSKPSNIKSKKEISEGDKSEPKKEDDNKSEKTNTEETKKPIEKSIKIQKQNRIKLEGKTTKEIVKNLFIELQKRLKNKSLLFPKNELDQSKIKQFRTDLKGEFKTLYNKMASMGIDSNTQFMMLYLHYLTEIKHPGDTEAIVNDLLDVLTNIQEFFEAAIEEGYNKKASVISQYEFEIEDIINMLSTVINSLIQNLPEKEVVRENNLEDFNEEFNENEESNNTMKKPTNEFSAKLLYSTNIYTVDTPLLNLVENLLKSGLLGLHAQVRYDESSNTFYFENATYAELKEILRQLGIDNNKVGSVKLSSISVDSNGNVILKYKPRRGREATFNTNVHIDSLQKLGWEERKLKEENKLLDPTNIKEGTKLNLKVWFDFLKEPHKLIMIWNESLLTIEDHSTIFKYYEEAIKKLEDINRVLATTTDLETKSELKKEKKKIINQYKQNVRAIYNKRGVKKLMTVNEFMTNLFGENWQDLLNTEEGRRQLLENETFVDNMPIMIEHEEQQINASIPPISWINKFNISLEEDKDGAIGIMKQKIKEFREQFKNGEVEATVTETYPAKLSINDALVYELGHYLKEGILKNLMSDNRLYLGILKGRIDGMNIKSKNESILLRFPGSKSPVKIKLEQAKNYNEFVNQLRLLFKYAEDQNNIKIGGVSFMAIPISESEFVLSLVHTHDNRLQQRYAETVDKLKKLEEALENNPKKKEAFIRKVLELGIITEADLNGDFSDIFYKIFFPIYPILEDNTNKYRFPFVESKKFDNVLDIDSIDIESDNFNEMKTISYADVLEKNLVPYYIPIPVETKDGIIVVPYIHRAINIESTNIKQNKNKRLNKSKKEIVKESKILDKISRILNKYKNSKEKLTNKDARNLINFMYENNIENKEAIKLIKKNGFEVFVPIGDTLESTKGMKINQKLETNKSGVDVIVKVNKPLILNSGKIVQYANIDVISGVPTEFLEKLDIDFLMDSDVEFILDFINNNELGKKVDEITDEDKNEIINNILEEEEDDFNNICK